MYMAELEAATGMAERDVRRSLDRLEKAGVIWRKKSVGGFAKHRVVPTTYGLPRAATATPSPAAGGVVAPGTGGGASALEVSGGTAPNPPGGSTPPNNNSLQQNSSAAARSAAAAAVEDPEEQNPLTIEHLPQEGSGGTAAHLVAVGAEQPLPPRLAQMLGHFAGVGETLTRALVQAYLVEPSGTARMMARAYYSGTNRTGLLRHMLTERDHLSRVQQRWSGDGIVVCCDCGGWGWRPTILPQITPCEWCRGTGEFRTADPEVEQSMASEPSVWEDDPEWG
jgi:DNA-binding MarR family transcriptional regulator